MDMTSLNAFFFYKKNGGEKSRLLTAAEKPPADEPKKTKSVQGWSRQIMGGRLLLFAILLLCETTTSFVWACI